MSEPRQVFLFSGHMIDAKGRQTPRYPPDKEPVAARAIAAVLDEFGAARVKVGQPAKVRVNAFTDKTLTGKVSEIADQSVLLASGDVSYPVTIILDTQDPDLRWGMTVKVEFQE